ncbi:MAG: M48 family metallopeptidase [Bacteroidales bacterium]|jgi:predicted metal-dependent hydrolase|nr:M48 family metallopeptidase [Bacteroidales bacterium]
MKNIKIISDKILGDIVLQKNPRARKYLLRVKDGRVVGTIPRYGTEKFMFSFIEREKTVLLKYLEKWVQNHAKNTFSLPEKYKNLGNEALKKQLRADAKHFLPERLNFFAQQYGFQYNGLRFSSAKTRWGSCNNKKSISLNIKLMLLPQHLTDYVILHELCHTVEMNHSQKFWQLLDCITQHQARTLRKELRRYSTIPALDYTV